MSHGGAAGRTDHRPRLLIWGAGMFLVIGLLGSADAAVSMLRWSRALGSRASGMPALVMSGSCGAALAGGGLALLFAERRRRGLLRDNDRLAALVATDPLTGLPNRRSFDWSLDRAWRAAARDGTTLSLILVDADHFKLFNDHFGHLEGDRVLRAAAVAMAGQLRRPSDSVSRIGGEEFAILLPGTDSDGATHVAQAVRAAIAAQPLLFTAPGTGRFTVSMGISDAAPATAVESGPEALFAAADRALYRAKSDGRDRIRIGRLHDAAPGAASATIDGLEILFPGGRAVRVTRPVALPTLASLVRLLSEG